MRLQRFARLTRLLPANPYNRWLTLAQLLWGALVIWSLALFITRMPASLAILHCDPTIMRAIQPDAGFASFPPLVQTYILFHLAAGLLLILVSTVMAFIIFVYKSADSIALLVALMLIVGPVGASCVISGQWESQSAWSLPLALTRSLGFSSYYIFLYLFPNGRFVPQWTRWLVLGVVMIEILLPFRLWWLGSMNFDLVWAFFLVTGIGTQIYRYHTVSDSVERQQTKWVVLGITVTGACYITDILLPPSALVTLSQIEPSYLITMFTRTLFSLLYLLCLPLAIALAILRYRLWDIDIVIRRTLTYTLLSILLALVYFSSVVVLQELSRLLTGSVQSQLVSVASTLAIVGLFTPLRRRLQDGIDRRFHRRKYNAMQVVAVFTAACHNEVDLARLSGEFGRVMQATLQPAQIGLWLKPANEQKRSNAAVHIGGKERGEL